jgi:3-oxoacyl-[acyl-carrier protein] reductase
VELGLTGGRALVTGGSQGLGRATVLALAEEGCDVAFCARRREPLDLLAHEVQERFGRAAVPIVADVRDPADCVRLVADAADALGGVDVVVNNAGASVLGNLWEIPDEVFFEGLDLKLRGYIRIARAAIPFMQERGGVIVNVAGNTGYFPFPTSMAGGAANAGIMNFTVALSQEVAKHQIRVVCIAPGGIATNRLTSQVIPDHGRSSEAPDAYASYVKAMPLGRVPTAEEVAAVITFLASARCPSATGTTLIYDGGAGRALTEAWAKADIMAR